MGIDINKLNIGQMTHVGRKREINQDHMGVFPFQEPFPGVLLVVADGMGGAKAGEVASQLAVKTITEDFLSGSSSDITARLQRSIVAANTKVHEQAQAGPEYKGMGTTVVAVVLTESQLFVSHVGDSRVFLLSPQAPGLSQLTEDHSWINEQIKKGLVTAEQAKSHPKRKMITRALGHKNEVKIDSHKKELTHGDTVLLCSDGLTDYVSANDMQAIISRFPAQQACAELVDLANSRGGGDNITVVCAQTVAVKELRATGVEKKDREMRLFPLVAAVLLILAGLFGYLFIQPGEDKNPPPPSAGEEIELVKVEDESTKHVRSLVKRTFGKTKDPDVMKQLRQSIQNYLASADENEINGIINYIAASAMEKKPFDIEDLSFLIFLQQRIAKNPSTTRNSVARLSTCIETKRNNLKDVKKKDTREAFDLAENGSVTISRRAMIMDEDYLESNWWNLYIPRSGEVEFKLSGEFEEDLSVCLFSRDDGQMDLDTVTNGTVYRAQVNRKEHLYVKISPSRPNLEYPLEYGLTIVYKGSTYE